MDTQQLEIEGTWEEIAAHAPRFAGRRVRLIVLPDEPQVATETLQRRTLDEKIAEIVSEVPDEEWSKLPLDLGDQLDHYIYGTPKRE
jgi:hypothetical protein